MAGTVRAQASPPQHRRDRFHHQLVFMAILGGVQQPIGQLPQGGRAGQGVAAQLPLPQGEKPLRRGPQQRFAVALLPEEAAAAGLAAAQLGQQLQRI